MDQSGGLSRLPHFSFENAILKAKQGVPVLGNKCDHYPWGCRFNPWPHSVCYGSGIAMNRGVGRCWGWDPVWLWMWHRLVAVVPIRPLAWECPYATDVALKKKKKAKQTAFFNLENKWKLKAQQRIWVRQSSLFLLKGVLTKIAQVIKERSTTF